MTALHKEPSDADLAEMAAAGDRDAFEQLFARHVSHVRAICRQRLGTSADVDDAVQETFARALANLHQLRDAAGFGPWVRSIAVRACADHHRATRRVIATPVEELDLTDNGPEPDELVVAFEDSASVHRSLAQLGPRDAHALWLRHVTGAPVTEVADELGLTPGSARVLLTRARHRLRAATTLLPALVPLSWRQWLRDHLPTSAPALDAMVAIVALGLVAGVVGVPADGAQARTPTVTPGRIASEDASAPRAERPVAGAQTRAERARERDRRQPSAGSRDDRGQRADRTPASSDAGQPRREITVADAVTVTNEYPSEDEAERLATVKVVGGDQKLGEFRFYGTAPQEVKQTRRALPVPAKDGVAAGGVSVTPGDGNDGDGKASRRR